MGQHKYNPTAIKARHGEIPPKPPRISKREQLRKIDTEIKKRMGVDRFFEELDRSYFEI